MKAIISFPASVSNHSVTVRQGHDALWLIHTKNVIPSNMSQKEIGRHA